MNLLQNSFLIRCKNTISARNQKDYNLLLILNQQKSKPNQPNPLTIFTSTCEKLAPGSALLPKVRAGRVSFTPGKIKHSAAIFKSIQWILQEVKTPKKQKFPLRFSQELKHIMENTGAALNHKKNYIKEIRLARLNWRRRRPWIKYLTRKNFRRRRKLAKRKAKLKNKTKKSKFIKVAHKKKPRYKRRGKWRKKRFHYRFLRKRRKWQKKRVIRWEKKTYLTWRKFSRKKRKKLLSQTIKKKVPTKKNRSQQDITFPYKLNLNTIISQKKTWKRLSFYENF